jgi:hypothetical protein
MMAAVAWVVFVFLDVIRLKFYWVIHSALIQPFFFVLKKVYYLRIHNNNYFLKRPLLLSLDLAWRWLI